MDVEDRAYYITTVNQRWVSVRLDLVTAFLTLLVAFLAVEKRKDTSPE